MEDGACGNYSDRCSGCRAWLAASASIQAHGATGGSAVHCTLRWPAASALVHGTEVPLKQRHNDMVSIWVQISLTNELGAPERNME